MDDALVRALEMEADQTEGASVLSAMQAEKDISKGIKLFTLAVVSNNGYIVGV